MIKHPKRWRDCKPFVDALLKRQYVLPLGGPKDSIHTCMAEGQYLYMYELWQDGFDRRSADVKLVQEIDVRAD